MKSEPLYSAWEDEEECCSSKVFWWEPPRDSLAVAYCRETSMHGLKYVAEPKRHLSERICWLLAFLTGVGAAVYLISNVWERYHKNPVIVSFQPTETDIKDIPFPAVTFCNMNRFPRSLYDDLIQKSTNMDLDEETRDDAKTDLQFLKSICGTQRSFAQRFNYAATRGKIRSTDFQRNESNGSSTTLELFSLLIEKTIPCEDLIRLCVWSQENKNCSELFKPIVTEYGKCCTFNLLPHILLLAPKSHTRYNDTAGTTSSRTKKRVTPRWSEEELKKWEKWDYKNDGFKLHPDLERPYRQSRAGVPFGLSVLVDANTDQYFCPSTDSEGFRLVLHTSLEMPPVQNWGVAIGMGKEIFMDIMPKMTIADSKIRSFPYEKRACYFQSEKSLNFYNAYTTSNCLDECIALLTAEKCQCTLFYMQRGAETRVCSSIPGSEDYSCAMEAQSNLTKNFRDSCKNCDSLCTDIFYSVEQTQADIQPSDQLWGNPGRNEKIPPWSNHTMSIVHLYFGTDSLVPQVRSELYALVDLIANTGGLLGLCLGFSALSAIEFLYFFTIRFFWQKVRQRTIGRRIARKFINAIWKSNKQSTSAFVSASTEKKITRGLKGGYFEKSKNHVIDMDKNLLPCYPAYGFSNSGRGPQVASFQNQDRGEIASGNRKNKRFGGPEYNPTIFQSDFYSNSSY